MDILSLVKEFGPLLACLIVAVVALWRSWRAEVKLRELEKSERMKKLEVSDDELRELYRKLAKPSLDRLTELANQQDIPALSVHRKKKNEQT